MSQVARPAELDVYARPNYLRRVSVDNPLVVNLGCGGLGDALLGACAVQGLRTLHPGRQVVYKASLAWIPFVNLFDMGNTLFSHHDWDGASADVPPDAKPFDLQMNVGYEWEKKTKSACTRLERYCRNLGGVTPELPQLKHRDRLMEQGKDYRGCVALAPFGAWLDREYPVHAWMTVEKMLLDAGYSVVILDARHKDFPERHQAMRSPCLLDAPPEQVAGVLLNAACFVGNDSGMAHLSAIMGQPTVVLCGQVFGNKIYDFYPRVKCLQGVLNCSGCYWQLPECVERCQTLCAALASITPERVLRAVGEFVKDEVVKVEQA